VRDGSASAEPSSAVRAKSLSFRIGSTFLFGSSSTLDFLFALPLGLFGPVLLRSLLVLTLGLLGLLSLDRLCSLLLGCVGTTGRRRLGDRRLCGRSRLW
jgi:hypothetical protein